MHELYIAQSILTSVKKSLPPEVPSEKVSEVRVQVGQLDAVVDENLIFLFDAIKAESGMPRATLALEDVKVVCRCNACKQEFGLDLPVFLCPECGSSDIELLRGRGIMLTGITAYEDEEDNGYTGHP